MNLQWNEELQRRYGVPVQPDKRAAIITLGGIPVVGFGQAETVVAPVAAASSPWALALATSVVGAATGWFIEEVARKVRGRRQ